jgi:outer membrane protein, adhesin transport system
MKTINKKVLASCIFAISSSNVFALDMTLADVITKTLDTHPEYQEAEKKVESARQRIVQAKAGYLPTVDLTLGTGYERTENQTTINRNLGNSNKSADANLNRQEAVLSVTQMLFDGFATPARVERSRAEFENQLSYSKEVAEKVAVSAAQAFYAVLREEDNLIIDKQNLRMHKNYQSQIDKRVKSGKSNKADLEQVNSRVALAESQVVQREELLEQAKSEFFRQVGIEAENLIPNEVDYSLVPASLDESVEIAYFSNPRIKSLEAALQASKQTIIESKSAYMPTVNLELTANRNQNMGGIDKKDQSEQAMVRMRYNLFNGGADQANHLASIADEQASTKALEDTKRAVERDIRSAWYEYQLTSKRLISLNEQVRSAKSTKIAYKSQFDVGQRTLLDVLDSEREYNSARETLQTAKLSRDLSVYQLLGLMGQLSDSFTKSEVILELEDASKIDSISEDSLEVMNEDAAQNNVAEEAKAKEIALDQAKELAKVN